MKITIATILLCCLSFSGFSQEVAQPEKAVPSPDKLSQTKKNMAAGEVFLTKNAKALGIKVLPSGLQYRVIQTGTGRIPTTNELVFIKYRGQLIDGTEFDHHNRFLTWTTGGIRGWQEAMQKMKVGSKWQIFVPPALAFGDEGDEYLHIPSGATLVYDLELLSIAPPNPELSTGGLGHGLSENNTSAPHPVPSAQESK